MNINPRIFEKIADKLMPIALIGAFTGIIIGLPIALLFSPEDYQQGETVRIMYIHVPAAWLAMLIYFLMAGFSLSFLVWKNPFSYVLARSIAPIGAVFALICLITGSIWGYPTWGTWWVWDARLTSMLILFFLYLGYIGMKGAFEEEEREAKSASILGLVGAINLPIIKFSVDWWNTLHQPASVFKISGPTIDSSMLLPLGLMTIGLSCLFLVIWVYRVRTALLLKKL